MNEQVQYLLEKMKELDAQQMEDFLDQLGNYFIEHRKDLTNMDAKSIAIHIWQASSLIGKRTGN